MIRRAPSGPERTTPLPRSPQRHFVAVAEGDGAAIRHRAGVRSLAGRTVVEVDVFDRFVPAFPPPAAAHVGLAAELAGLALLATLGELMGAAWAGGDPWLDGLALRRDCRAVVKIEIPRARLVQFIDGSQGNAGTGCRRRRVILKVLHHLGKIVGCAPLLDGL
jgi:hypothetical protein